MMEKCEHLKKIVANCSMVKAEEINLPLNFHSNF
jgi:hypothetical protein